MNNPELYLDNENENMTKEGARVWVAWRNKVLYDEQGKTTGLLSLGYNITERKLAEEKLQRSMDGLEKEVAKRTRELARAKMDAERANNAKSEFLANISHELRNPMHQILSYTKYGIEKIERPKEKLLHYFQQTRKSADRLMYLLNDLLDLTKMEAGRMDYRMESNNVFQIVNEAVLEIKPVFEEKKAVFADKGYCSGDHT